MIDRRLQVFYTVARTGNITKAAHILHMTQPAVTSQIQKFEQYYDVELLNRHHNGVSLTSAGQSIFHHVRAIINLHEAIDRKLISCKKSTLDSSLRIGVTAGAADFLLRVIATKFHELYHDIEMQIYVDDYESIKYKLEHHSIELALVEEGRMQKKFQVEMTWQDPLVVVMPVDHPLAALERVTAEDLSHYPIICRDNATPLYNQVFQRRPGTLDIYENYGSMDAVLDAVKLEIGLAVIPKTSVLRLSKTDRCIVRDLDPPHIQVLLLIRCRHHPCGEPARKMLGYARCCAT